jgi:hypothetical protein
MQARNRSHIRCRFVGDIRLSIEPLERDSEFFKILIDYISIRINLFNQFCYVNNTGDCRNVAFILTILM